MPSLVTPANVMDCTPSIEQSSVNSAAAALLADGRVLMVYGGPALPSAANAGTTSLYAIESFDDGESWGLARLLIRRDDTNAVYPALLQAGNGRLWCFYVAFGRSEWHDGEPNMLTSSCDIRCTFSDDAGRTWSAHRTILVGFCMAPNGVIETTSGAYVLPVSYVVPNPGRVVSACLISRDAGNTWQLGQTIDLGGHGEQAGALEPTVTQLNDGRLWMLMRTGRGRFWQALSDDDGLTWIDLSPTPIRSHSDPCHMLRLSNGSIALAWNDTLDTDHPPDAHEGTVGASQRDRLSLVVTRDEGHTWSPPVELARGRQMSHPFITEVAPGRLLVGFRSGDDPHQSRLNVVAVNV